MSPYIRKYRYEVYAFFFIFIPTFIYIHEVEKRRPVLQRVLNLTLLRNIFTRAAAKRSGNIILYYIYKYHHTEPFYTQSSVYTHTHTHNWLYFRDNKKILPGARTRTPPGHLIESFIFSSHFTPGKKKHEEKKKEHCEVEYWNFFFSISSSLRGTGDIFNRLNWIPDFTRDTCHREVCKTYI